MKTCDRKEVFILTHLNKDNTHIHDNMLIISCAKGSLDMNFSV